MSITCAITGKYYIHLRGFLNNLRAMGITSREYYDRYIKTPEEDICGCGNKVAVLVIPNKSESRKRKLDGSKKLIDWAISSQASNLDGCIIKYEEGSTTILCGVESSDSKCRGSLRQIREQDIVWSSVKIEAV